MRNLCLLVVALLASSNTLAAESDPLFASQDTLAITLVGPFERIDDERDKDQEYEGALHYVDASGATVELDARFEVRGNWRLDPSNCEYSQLWVDLRRGQLPGTLFENQNRLKLVVQCRRNDRYLEYLEREMQAYRIYSLLTDYHFAIRPLEVTYQDNEEDESRTHAAFFIEHQNRVAELAGMEEVEENRVSSDQLDPVQSTLTSLFMFFVGNTDFSLIQAQEGEECCHNAKLMRDADGVYFPVPYDFDASGFVDANYAPQPGFNLRSTRQRLYRGYCVDDSAMTTAVDRFLSVKDEITAIAASRKNDRFVEDFFEVLEDERDFRRDILNDCR